MLSKRNVIWMGVALGLGLSLAIAGASAGTPVPTPGPYPLTTCPVSGKKLGDMGPPVTHPHAGREVKLCCEGCVSKFENDSATFLKKLDDAVVAAQKPSYPLAACPISGRRLGSMGTPVEHVHLNRLVRVCCPQCEPRVAKKAASVFATLDRAVLAAQRPAYPLTTCVVSKKPLGAMGKPVDVVVGTRLFRLCCEGCRGKLEAAPREYVATVDAALIAKQLETYPLKTCVVKGATLGSMGEPVNKLVGTRLVRFCCSGCIAKFEADPEKYLAKLR